MRREFTDASDAALVVSIGRYQQAALAEAYRRHAGAAFGLAKRLLNDHARAEEVVQEVFVRLWNEPNRFDPERGTLRSFLLADTHGRSVDLIRSDVARRRGALAHLLPLLLVACAALGAWLAYRREQPGAMEDRS